MADTPTGYPEWKNEIPDEGYELEDAENKTLEERVRYLELVLKSWRKEWKRNDKALFPKVAVEDVDKPDSSDPGSGMF